MSNERLTTLDISGPIIDSIENFKPEAAPLVYADTMTRLGWPEEAAKEYASEDYVKVRPSFLAGSIDAVAMSPVANRSAKLQIYEQLTNSINNEPFTMGSAGLLVDGRRFITRRLKRVESALYRSSTFQGESTDDIYEEVSLLRVHAARELPRMTPEQKTALADARRIRMYRNTFLGKAMSMVEIVNLIGDVERNLENHS